MIRVCVDDRCISLMLPREWKNIQIDLSTDAIRKSAGEPAPAASTTHAMPGAGEQREPEDGNLDGDKELGDLERPAPAEDVPVDLDSKFEEVEQEAEALEERYGAVTDAEKGEHKNKKLDDEISALITQIISG